MVSLTEQACKFTLAGGLEKALAKIHNGIIDVGLVAPADTDATFCVHFKVQCLDQTAMGEMPGDLARGD